LGFSFFAAAPMNSFSMSSNLEKYYDYSSIAAAPLLEVSGRKSPSSLAAASSSS
jgi:hypothetical protein